MLRRVLVLCLLLPPTGAAAQSRLVGERIEGASRQCIYEAPRTAASLIARSRPGQRVSEDVRGALSRSVGLGEPCPATYRSPPALAEPIPSLALLKDRLRQDGRTFCVYTFGGRDYRLPVAASGSCPLTPNMIGAGEAGGLAPPLPR